MKINITKEALQSICEESTYLTIAHNRDSYSDLITKIDAIIEKYRPSFIPKEDLGYPGYNKKYPVIRYQYSTYSSLDEMLAGIPYGGASVSYPPYEWDAGSIVHGSAGYHPGNTQCIPVLNTQYVEHPCNWQTDNGYMKGNGLPDNRVFVLTVTCNYPFSSSMVKMLFNGGVNTKPIKINATSPYYASLADQPRGTMYLLWARGAGIVNPK